MGTDFGRDISHALRGLRRTPGFTIVAVLTLALGIGANTAIFSVVNAALLRPLPFRNPQRLVFLWNRTQDGDPNPLAPARMLDLTRQMTSFDSVAGIAHLSLTLTDTGEPELLSGASVSSTFFDVLGVRALFGDTFHGGRADPSAVVLGYNLWRRRFGADPALVGRTITLNGRPRLVLAVMGPDFTWPFITARPTIGAGPDLWIPAGLGDVPRAALNEEADMTANRTAGYLRLVARLKERVTTRQADVEARTAGASLARDHPEDGGLTAMVVGIRDQFYGGVERPLYVLAGAVGFVLAIACANIASLLLGRSASHRRDLALRRALGAGRGRIFRQLLTEAVVLSLIGTMAGMLLAWWGTATLLRFAPPDLTSGGAAFDVRVLVFTLAIALVSAVAFGTLPAIQLSTGDLSSELAESSVRTTGSRRSGFVRDALAVSEIALAVVLLVGAGLLTRSFLALSRVDTGIDTRNLMTFDVKLTGIRAQSQARQVEFYAALQRRFERVPGVIAAGSAVTLPIGGDDFGTGILIEGRPVPRPGDEPHGGYQVTMPGFFTAMGIPIRQGRDFTASDTHTSVPVVLVNEALARQQWPGTDPIGRRIRFNADGPWMTVVGVVGDIRHSGPSVPPRPEVYQPASQRSFPFMAFVVRTAGDPYTFAQTIRRAAAEIDPILPLANMKTMDEHVAAKLARPRFLSLLVVLFGVLALILAIVGIYGVVAWSVGERRREFAIRIALGARSRLVAAMVLRRAMTLAGIGIAAGIAGTRAGTHVLMGLLFSVRPADRLTYALIAAIVAAVALAASAVPVRRAAH
ncbi:MAG TPA: ABC transporter permease, partial [Vicinamibacterales bacterium]